MKQVFLGFLLCAGFAGAQNATVVPKPALYLTRDNSHPPKAATQATFQCFLGTLAALSAASVIFVLKSQAATRAADLNKASMELTIDDVSFGMVLAGVSGAMFTGTSGVLWAQGLSNYGYALTSYIWNADELTPVKTPLSVLP